VAQSRAVPGRQNKAIILKEALIAAIRPVESAFGGPAEELLRAAEPAVAADEC
jgi:hypothetical protein